MIVLQEATAVQLDPPSARENVDIAIDGPNILEVAPGAAGRHAAARRMPLRGAVVCPGLVCGHHHLYSTLARGILARIRPSSDLLSTLQNLWWRLDRAIDGEILEASARVGCLEAIRAGTTAVIDHHASPSFIRGSLELLKRSFTASGLRGVLCYEATDRNGQAGCEEGVEEGIAFARAVDAERAGGRVPLVEAMIGGHAPFTLSDRSLRLLADAVERTGRGFHVHAAEDPWDGVHSRAEHGRDPLERLQAFGLLGPRTIVAHGVHLSKPDVSRLNEAGAFLVHCGRSNMGNRVGRPRRLFDVRHAALGTDGIGADMLAELQSAWLRHRDAGGGRAPGDFLAMLQGGNALLARQFGARFGRIEAGCRADLVVFDYLSPTPLVGENVAGHLVWGLGAADVRTVIVDGRIVYEDRKFPFDPEPIYREARSAARRLWERMDRLETEAT